jgi:hypothetical protein
VRYIVPTVNYVGKVLLNLFVFECFDLVPPSQPNPGGRIHGTDGASSTVIHRDLENANEKTADAEFKQFGRMSSG